MIPLLRHQGLLLLVSLLIFFTHLGDYTLFNDDEAKNAVCATEMFRRGDIIVPTFYEELRTDKPILLYWFMLTSFKLFGISEFSARLASSIFSVGTVLLTYHIGRKLYSDGVGLLAGLILGSCLLFSAVGRAATPDPALIFSVTLALANFVWVVSNQRGGNFSGENELSEESPTSEETPSPEALSEAIVDDASEQDATSKPQPAGPLFPVNWKTAAPFYAAMGIAVLAKGPVGLVLPFSAIVLFQLITLRERDLKADQLKIPEGSWWRRWILMIGQTLRPVRIAEALRGMHALIGFGIVAAVALPWYVAVGVQTNGAWLRGFLLDHNVGRALLPKENHNGFPFFYLYQLVAIHLGCFPWSVFLPVAIERMRLRFRDGATWRDSDRLLACWGGVWFVVFSLVSTRLPNYLLPMYPAVALILARYFHDWERDEVGSGVYSFNLCCRAMGIVGAVGVVGVYIAAFLLFGGEQWLSLICLIPILGAFIAVKFLDQEQRPRVMQTLLGTAVLLAFVIVGIAPPSVGKYQDTPKFIADAKRKAGGEEIEIATYKYFQPTVLFYAGKKIPILKSTREVADFLASHRHPFVITRASEMNDLRNDVLSDFSTLSTYRNFIKRDELILIGRN